MLCRIVPLHLGQVSFRFHFGKLRKVIMFMIFGPSGHDNGPQNQLFLTLDTSNYFKQYKKNTATFKTYYSCESQNLKNRKIRKDACRQILNIRFQEFLVILNLGSIPFKEQEWTAWNCSIQVKEFWRLKVILYFQLRESPHPSQFRFPLLHRPAPWGTQVEVWVAFDRSCKFSFGRNDLSDFVVRDFIIWWRRAGTDQSDDGLGSFVSDC